MEHKQSRPLVLIDFDGVVNQFPDGKVRRHQNTTSWMKPGDARMALYAPDHWFVPDNVGVARAGGSRWRIHWSSTLVRRLDALDADIWWLSTWQPYTEELNYLLGVDWKTVEWYDPVTRNGILTGKRRAVLSHLKRGRPIVWIDDEEVTQEAADDLKAAAPQAPVLGIGPSGEIGISQPQMELIDDFVANPPNWPVLRFNAAEERHSSHWGY